MPTAKRQKYIEKQKKKLDNQRTKEEREERTNEIKLKLKETFLTPNMFEEIGLFYNIIDKFVEDGISVNGAIPIKHINSTLLYNLTNNKTKPLDAMIKYNGSNDNKVKKNKKEKKLELKDVDTEVELKEENHTEVNTEPKKVNINNTTNKVRKRSKRISPNIKKITKSQLLEHIKKNMTN